MMRTFLKSKIHRATVTETVLAYEGSITIDPGLMAAAALDRYEKVQVLNLNTGARFETYVLPGTPGAGQICLNGPAARLGVAGDTVLVVSYVLVPEAEKHLQTPVVVHVDRNNRVTRKEVLKV